MRSHCLQQTRPFPTLAGALAAVRAWVDQAEVDGWKRPELCALVCVKRGSAAAMLGTRRFVACFMPPGAPANAIEKHAPEDTLVMIEQDGVPPRGGALANIDAVLTIIAADKRLRSDTQ